jgi:hypothetical protein
VGSYEFFVCLRARNPGLFLGCWFLIYDALLIECEQAFENLFVGYIDRETVRAGYCTIEFRMCIGEPGWTFVVKVGERPLCQFGSAIVVARFDDGIMYGANPTRVSVDNET